MNILVVILYLASSVFSFPVVHQAGNYDYVSPQPGTATIFEAPLQNDVIGFLGHDYLIGQQFKQMKVGDRVEVVYPDRRDVYKVRDLWTAVYINPHEMYLNGVKYYEWQVFDQVYKAPGRLVLQTCIPNGLLFVIAAKEP